MNTTEKTNPLLNDVVLDVLFKQMQIEDVNKCRLVCKQWNSRVCEILKKSWQDLKIINLHVKSDTINFQKEMRKSTNKQIFSGFRLTVRICKFLQKKFFEDHEPKLLLLQLKPWSHLDSKNREIDLFDISTVLWYSANYLRELRIEFDSKLISPKKDVNYNHLINFSFPHLKTIKIEFTEYDCDSEACINILLSILQVICQKSSKLESIFFRNAPKCQSIVFDSINKSQVLENLQEFGITFKWLRELKEESSLGTKNLLGPSNLLEMRKFGIKFKNLTLKFTQTSHSDPDTKIYIQNNFKIFTQFLQNQSQDLETLTLQVGIAASESNENRKIGIIHNQFAKSIKLPNFDKLKKLTLGKNPPHCFNDQNNLKYIPFNTIDVQQKFPVLQEINLKFGGGTDWDDLFTGTLNTVTTLRIKCLKFYPMNIKDETVNNFHQLEKIFPNIKIFQVSRIDCIINCEEKNPWEKTVQVLIINNIQSEDINNLDLSIFKHYKVLQRLELYQYILPSLSDNRNQVLWQNFNLEVFNNLELKSFKVHNFELSDYVVEAIHEKCVFDYKPYRVKAERDYDCDSVTASETDSESDSELDDSE